MFKLNQLNNYLWEIPKTAKQGMLVPARFYATEQMLKQILKDRSLEQLVNVAFLSGIEKYSLAMPDIHEGYGFPIGGVAALRTEDGVISPGGVGYDINCGVRLLKSEFNFNDIKNYLTNLTNQIQHDVPSGVGRGGKIKLNLKELDHVLEKGASWAVGCGYATADDLEFLESKGRMEQADAGLVSEKAKQRGRDQLGTLGAGNHFLEIQQVEQIFDKKTAVGFGLEKDQITIMIHTGSRGLGHQVCTDYVRLFNQSMNRYQLKLPDRELAAAPFKSSEGQNYFKAMAAAANFAWVNRTIVANLVLNAWQKILGKTKLQLVYDVAHNIAKIENYNGQDYIIHRKGATRCFGPEHSDLPEKYRSLGQPIIIPGSMGTSSYILVGTKQAMLETFGSTCHGAGRAMSRSSALKNINYQQLKNILEKEKGIILRAGSKKSIIEEAPQAYKNIDEVIKVVHQAGIATKVARLKPLAVIKG